MTCKVIDAKMLFDAIRKNEDDFWKAATIITIDNISSSNKNKVAKSIIKSESAKKWFKLKLLEYEYMQEDNDFA